MAIFYIINRENNQFFHSLYTSNNAGTFNLNELFLVQLSLGTKMADH